MLQSGQPCSVVAHANRYSKARADKGQSSEARDLVYDPSKPLAEVHYLARENAQNAFQSQSNALADKKQHEESSRKQVQILFWDNVSRIYGHL